MKVSTDTDAAEIISPWSTLQSEKCASFQFSGYDIKVKAFSTETIYARSFVLCPVICSLKLFINLPSGDTRLSFISETSTEISGVVLQEGACDNETETGENCSMCCSFFL